MINMVKKLTKEFNFIRKMTKEGWTIKNVWGLGSDAFNEGFIKINEDEYAYLLIFKERKRKR